AQYPQYADQIIAAARESFLAGDQNAYIAGIVSVLVGAALVAFVFPRHDREVALLSEYHDQDSAAEAPAV
ncbi:MAG: MFS transporter, partial [Chloroflexi bacterium]|nr:MFS transporter [Chloroflexota bacterium]